MRVAFLTVSDRDFFPGTLATANSVLMFHPEAEILVVDSAQRPLTPPQRALIGGGSANVRILPASRFRAGGRHLGPWELKAYASSDLSGDYDVLVGIDSDCLLTGPVHDQIDACVRDGVFIGGKDGAELHYGTEYSPYGIPPGSRNDRYMSTSLYFVPCTESTRAILSRWAACCDAAVFNRRGAYAGHGDQGVLNAVLFAAGRSENVRCLDNRVWSQHWTYWQSVIAHDGESFRNMDAGACQRAFHCGGADKFWSPNHSRLVQTTNASQAYPYAWFLSMLWFGPLRCWELDPLDYLPHDCLHLLRDLVNFLPQISKVHPPARDMWDSLTDSMLDRLLAGVPRFLGLRGGTMTELIGLVRSIRPCRRFVEIGGYEGGSLLTLGIVFALKDIDFFSIESFLGNLDGTVDGHPLPSRERFQKNLARYTLRTHLISADSAHAASFFDDASLDIVFIDSCHRTEAVVRDIASWRPKIRCGGVIAGDDYGWPSVRAGVQQLLHDVHTTESGTIWWRQVT